MQYADVTGDREIEIENIEYDSRHIKPNSLFVAVTGFKVDGYNYVKEAVARGAVAVMGERAGCDEVPTHIKVTDARKALSDIAAKFYGYPGLFLKACGVTGTNGKTTTCYLLRNILQARSKKVGLITSQIYDTGEEKFHADRTTPEALDVQRLLFLMKQNNCNNVVLEVSSHALELSRVENINFRVAVFTNLTRDHLDFHETMENYLKAKAKLLDKLEGPLSYAVINLDVPEFRSLFGLYKASYMSYSLDNKDADVYCEEYDIRPDGTTCNLITPMGKITLNLKLPGRFNLYNTIAAVTAGLACGINLDNIISGVEITEPVPGRFNYIDGGQPFAVYIDFAHTPDAIERLIQSASEFTGGRILTLFGCGGDRDRGKRPLMGEVATRNSAIAVLTSDNPRTEDPLAIIEDVKPGLVGDNYKIIPDRTEAIKEILSLAQPGDVVLLAGKGDENYQEIQGVKHAFSDREVAIKNLEALGYTKSKAEINND